MWSVVWPGVCSAWSVAPSTAKVVPSEMSASAAAAVVVVVVVVLVSVSVSLPVVLAAREEEDRERCLWISAVG